MNRRQQGRRAVLWGLGCFVFLQMGLGAVLAWGPWWFLSDPLYGYKAYLLNKRLSGPGRPFTVVMLGSSRTFWGLDMAQLEQPLSEALGKPVVAFNFGQNGAGPATHLLFLRRLLAQQIRPDLVLLEIHPLLLAGQMIPADLTEGQLPASILWQGELARVRGYVGEERPGLTREWFDSWALPAYGHRLALLNYLAPDLLPHANRHAGFEQLNRSGVLLPTHRIDNPTPQQRQVALHHSFDCYKEHRKGFRLGGPHVSALQELLELCRKEGLTVALVLSPEGEVFRSWYPPGSWEQVNRYVRSLSLEFAVPLIDAHDWIKEEDFSDSHHLLPRGRDLYTQRLGREGILPLLPVKGSAARAGSNGNKSPG